MAINRYKGQPLPIKVKYDSNPLTPYGKSYGDVVDVVMNFKKDPANDTDNQYLEKKQSTGGVAVNENEHTFTMAIAQDDYTKLVVGETYYLVLAVQITGFTDYLELPIQLEDSKVIITDDKNRF